MKSGLAARLRLRWQVRGRNVIIPLAVERRFWRLAYALRNPRATLYYRRKRRARPAVGGQALVHGEHVQTVTGYGDDPDTLLFADGSSASWMNCCEPADG